MPFRPLLFIPIKVVVLALVHVVAWVVFSALFLPSDGAGPDPGLLLPIAADAMLTASLVAYLVVRARWSGPRLFGALFLLLFGVRVFLAQIETAVFPAALQSLPAGVFRGLWLAGIGHLGVLCAAAVWLFGRWRGSDAASDAASDVDALRFAPAEWGLRIALGSFAYPVLYFAIGYSVAWQVPEIREYYSGSRVLVGFWENFAIVLRDSPWLPFFQLERGLFWTLLGLVAVLLLRGRRDAPLAVALVFTVAMVSQLLLPGPHMNEAVRLGHLRELTLSGILHGLWVGLVLTWRRSFWPMRQSQKSAAGMTEHQRLGAS